MLAIYAFFLGFQLMATLACAILCYKIAYLRLTPTLTWLLFFFAFVIRLIQLANSIIYLTDIVKFSDQYSMWIIVLSQFLNASIIGLFLIGIFRIHNALKENGITK